MKPVTLAVFNSREEAEPVRRYLCDAGIWAEIRSESGHEGLLRFARPSAGVKVEVPREDFEEALRLVYDFNASATGSSALDDKDWMPWMSKENKPRKGDQV